MYTENDQAMDLGDGFWKTVEGLGNYKHIFADPEGGQVALMGTMREAGAALLMSLRLRVELGRITEIESVYSRQGDGGPSGIADLDKPGYKPEDMWFKSIPSAQRPSRQEMIAIADGYFTGLQKNDGKGVNGTGTYPFTNDCDRIENGAHTTNLPRPPSEPRRGQRIFHGLHVAVQAGLLLRGAEHPPSPLPGGGCGARRGLVTRGVRSGYGERGHAVGWPQIRLQGFNRPGSLLVTEAFLIENGKIRRVEMIGPSADVSPDFALARRVKRKVKLLSSASLR